MRPTHILILLVVLVILFGAKRLPDVARSVGQSMKVFKKEITELQDDDARPSTSAVPQPGDTEASRPAPAAPSER